MLGIIYVMGVSGSGKTTMARLIADAFSCPFFDGDDYHPPVNKDKMSNGIALDDDDRHGWLDNLNQLAGDQKSGAVIACSALKEKYRVQLANGLKSVHWVFLDGDFDTIYSRMKNRAGHFMPESLLQSQFDALERPEQAINLDIKNTTEANLAMVLKEIQV